MNCSLQFLMYEMANMQEYACIVCKAIIHPQELVSTHYHPDHGIRCLECPPYSTFDSSSSLDQDLVDIN